jgi:hypothetical protein
MNSVYLPALTALSGSVIGGLTSFASAWLTQHHQDRARRLLGEKARRALEGDDAAARASLAAIEEARKRHGAGEDRITPVAWQSVTGPNDPASRCLRQAAQEHLRGGQALDCGSLPLPRPERKAAELQTRSGSPQRGARRYSRGDMPRCCRKRRAQ